MNESISECEDEWAVPLVLEVCVVSGATAGADLVQEVSSTQGYECSCHKVLNWDSEIDFLLLKVAVKTHKGGVCFCCRVPVTTSPVSGLNQTNCSVSAGAQSQEPQPDGERVSLLLRGEKGFEWVHMALLVRRESDSLVP